jgi:hypothetical protein
MSHNKLLCIYFTILLLFNLCLIVHFIGSLKKIHFIDRQHIKQIVTQMF